MLESDSGASMMLTVSSSSTWAIDSEATNYMTSMRSEFMAYKHSTHRSICVTDGNYIIFRSWVKDQLIFHQLCHYLQCYMYHYFHIIWFWSAE